MKIKTKRFNKDISLPKYEDLAAGFDFICRKNIEIKPSESKAIPGNIAMEIPDSYVLLIIPRSSTHARFELTMPHSIGIIDPFYRGDDNEIMLIFHNFGKEIAKIKKGDEIAQGILVKFEKVEFNEVNKLGDSNIKTWRKNKKLER